MATKHDCVLCKYLYSTPPETAVFENYIYREEGRSHKIHLCFMHDIELFKVGQYRFVEKYCDIANNVIGSDDFEFLNFMKSLGNHQQRRAQKYF